MIVLYFLVLFGEVKWSCRSQEEKVVEIIRTINFAWEKQCKEMAKDNARASGYRVLMLVNVLFEVCLFIFNLF